MTGPDPTDERKDHRPALPVSVSCRAGYRGEETPRSLKMGKRTVSVVRVLDQWLAPDHRYFKVLGDDDGVYIVRNDVAMTRWELVFFEQKQRKTNDFGNGPLHP
jgi:hypothetical protein